MESYSQINTPTDSGIDWSHLNVLLVDDNEINLKLAKTLLEGRNVNVDTSDNGESAVELANNNYYDIIFMDLHMPKADGFQATELIRSSENPCKKSIIIALTANAMPEEQMRVFETGMNDILIKPISEERIFNIFERWLQSEDQQPTRIEEDDTSVETDQPIYDEDEGKQLAGGNAQLADELFGMLIKELPEHQKRMGDAKENNNISDLKHHVHKLHGATSYCGVPKLRKLSKQLEDIIDKDETIKLDKAYLGVTNAIDEVINFFTNHIDNKQSQ